MRAGDVRVFCKTAWDHQPGETCPECGETADGYGNTESDFLNCSFPDCGCDGARLCMAPSGPSLWSEVLNLEKGFR